MTPAAYGFLLTALAGLCTSVGSVLAFFTHRTNRSFLAVSMGFSADVMLYVSGEHHPCTHGLVAGMALMAVSLLLFLK